MQGRNLNITKNVHGHLDKGNHNCLGDGSILTRRGGGRKGLALGQNRASPSEGWGPKCVREGQGVIIIIVIISANGA